MNLEDPGTRTRRLEDLSAGLAKEESLWKKCDAPVLHVDRRGATSNQFKGWRRRIAK